MSALYSERGQNARLKTQKTFIITPAIQPSVKPKSKAPKSFFTFFAQKNRYAATARPNPHSPKLRIPPVIAAIHPTVKPQNKAPKTHKTKERREPSGAGRNSK